MTPFVKKCCFLKVPKRENFSLAFFTLSEPIWVGDLGIAKKNRFFITLPLILMVFSFLPHTECAVNKKKCLATTRMGH
jgi:hypothetical protein